MKNSSPYVIIGVVAAPHGVHGELRVKIETDFPQRFDAGNRIAIRVGDAEPKEYLIETSRPHKGMVLLELEGVLDRDAADRLKGGDVVVRRDQVKALPERTWYVFELEGLEVFDPRGEELGVLTEVLHPGGNDVYVVTHPSTGRKTLLPAIKSVIVEVDLERRRMVAEPLEEYTD